MSCCGVGCGFGKRSENFFEVNGMRLKHFRERCRPKSRPPSGFSSRKSTSTDVGNVHSIPENALRVGFKILFQAGEQADGVGGVATDPAVGDSLDGNRVEIVPACATFSADDDQFGLLEYAEMLHDSAAVNILEVGAQVASGAGTVLEQVEELATARIGKGFEYQILQLRS